MKKINKKEKALVRLPRFCFRRTAGILRPNTQGGEENQPKINQNSYLLPLAENRMKQCMLSTYIPKN